jgi:uncharacterized membrane protein YfcA
MDKPSQQSQKSGWLTALAVAWDLGYIIALPIVILGFGGAYLDKTYTTSPLFLLIGIGFALIVTAFFISRKMKDLISKLQ